MGLVIVPVSLREASLFIRLVHRHHGPTRGHKFSVGVALGGGLVGVAVVGRLSNRVLDDGLTVEVTRTCTDGTPNANSMLYGAAWRAARAMGYRRAITYTQAGESGASLRAAGWTREADLPARNGWDTPSRRRTGHGEDGVERVRWSRIYTAPDDTEAPPQG